MVKSKKEIEPKSRELYEAVIAAAEETTLVGRRVIEGRSQAAGHVFARHACMVALFNLGLSASEIGRLFGRDHSTVLHAFDKLKNSGGNGDYLRRVSLVITKAAENGS